MATRQSDYSKWYYENYTKKGLKIGRKKSSLAAATQGMKSASQRNSIAGLTDKGKERAKALKASLNTQRQKAQEELKADVQQNIDAIKALIKALGKGKATAPQKEYLRAQIKALQAEYKNGKAEIKKQFDDDYSKQLANMKTDSRYRDTNSTAALSEQEKKELGQYRAQLDAQKKVAQQKADRDLQDLRTQRIKNVTQARQETAQARQEKKEALEKHRADMSQEAAKLRAKIMALSPYERGQQRDSLIAEIQALRSKNEESKRSINENYNAIKTSSQAKIRSSWDEYNKLKSQNRANRRNIGIANQIKLNKRIKELNKRKIKARPAKTKTKTKTKAKKSKGAVKNGRGVSGKRKTLGRTRKENP